MPERNESYDDGFKLTGQKLEAICNSSTKQMELVADKDKIKTTFKLKYVNKVSDDPKTIAKILEEKNEGDETIKALTIMLVGTRNDIETARISLMFANDIDESIVYDIWSSDKDWFNDALVPILEKLIRDVRKRSFFRDILDLTIGAKRASKFFPYASYFYYGGNIVDLLIRTYLGKSSVSSDHVFYWGDVVNVLNKRQGFKNRLIGLVVVTIIIGLVVGTVASIIANYITLYVLHWH